MTDQRQLDQASVEKLLAAMEEALAPVAREHGLELQRGRRVTFTDTSFTVQYVGSLLDAQGNARTPEAVAFEHHAACHGLDPAWLGAEVALNGASYRVTGLNLRAPKNRVCLENLLAGVQARCTPATLREAMAGPGPLPPLPRKCVCRTGHGGSPDDEPGARQMEPAVPPPSPPASAAPATPDRPQESRAERRRKRRRGKRKRRR
jgi:hypothetical protein